MFYFHSLFYTEKYFIYKFGLALNPHLVNWMDMGANVPRETRLSAATSISTESEWKTDESALGQLLCIVIPLPLVRGSFKTALTCVLNIYTDIPND